MGKERISGRFEDKSTGTECRVLTTATDAIGQQLVIYLNENGVFARRVSDFEMRFKRVTEAAGCMCPGESCHCGCPDYY